MVKGYGPSKGGYDVCVMFDGKKKRRWVKTEAEAKALGAKWLQEAADAKKEKRDASNPEMKILRRSFRTELASGALTAAFRICVEQMDSMNKLTIFGSPDYKELRDVCDAAGKRCCMGCTSVLPSSAFWKGSRMCKSCQNNPVVHCARSKRRLEVKTAASAVQAAKPKLPVASAVEDAFVRWIVPLLKEQGFVVVVMEEFRNADILARRCTWPNDTYVRIQAKADGGTKKDGKTPKVDKQIHFNATFGYGARHLDSGLIVTNDEERMLMLCGGKRGVSLQALTAMDYTVWCFDGRDVDSNQLQANSTKKLLRPVGQLPVSVAEVATCIDAAYNAASFPKTTYLAAMLDVQHVNQRKEMLLMLCLKQAVDQTLTFPTGNATVIDCIFRNLATQFKSYHLTEMCAGCAHKDKGFKVPYDVGDGVALFVAGFLVRCAGRYFFFHTCEAATTMVAKGRFTDKANGVRDVVGLNFAPPMPDKYHQWLFGRIVLQRDTNLVPFCAPVEVCPDGVLTVALLNEVSEDVADSYAMVHALDPDVPETCTCKLSERPDAVYMRRHLAQRLRKVKGEKPLPPLRALKDTPGAKRARAYRKRKRESDEAERVC